MEKTVLVSTPNGVSEFQKAYLDTVYRKIPDEQIFNRLNFIKFQFECYMHETYNNTERHNIKLELNDSIINIASYIKRQNIDIAEHYLFRPYKDIITKCIMLFKINTEVL